MGVESVNGGSAGKLSPKAEKNEQPPPERRTEQSEADIRAQEQSEDDRRGSNGANGVGGNVDIKT